MYWFTLKIQEPIVLQPLGLLKAWFVFMSSNFLIFLDHTLPSAVRGINIIFHCLDINHRTHSLYKDVLLTVNSICYFWQCNSIWKISETTGPMTMKFLSDVKLSEGARNQKTFVAVITQFRVQLTIKFRRVN